MTSANACSTPFRMVGDEDVLYGLKLHELAPPGAANGSAEAPSAAPPPGRASSVDAATAQQLLEMSAGDPGGTSGLCDACPCPAFSAQCCLTFQKLHWAVSKGHGTPMSPDELAESLRSSAKIFACFARLGWAGLGWACLPGLYTDSLLPA